jgi:arsenical pump membrane protein
LAVLLGVLTLRQVAPVVGIVRDATLAFVAILRISLVLDAAGFFGWAALLVARASRGAGRRLFVLTLGLGTLVAVFFANDGAAPILTPSVDEPGKALRLPPATVFAFVMPAGSSPTPPRGRSSSRTWSTSSPPTSSPSAS